MTDMLQGFKVLSQSALGVIRATRPRHDKQPNTSPPKCKHQVTLQQYVDVSFAAVSVPERDNAIELLIKAS